MSGKRRLSASVDAELVSVAEQAVARGFAESVSAWVNDALRLKADRDRRLRALDEFLDVYESEHGEITEEEMREAGRRARERAIVVRGQPEEGGAGTARRGEAGTASGREAGAPGREAGVSGRGAA